MSDFVWKVSRCTAQDEAFAREQVLPNDGSKVEKKWMLAFEEKEEEEEKEDDDEDEKEKEDDDEYEEEKTEGKAKNERKRTLGLIRQRQNR